MITGEGVLPDLRPKPTIAVYTGIVYTVPVLKNITLSADDAAIERVREVARSRNTTLNELFRDWLEIVGGQEARAEAYRALMDRLRHVNAGRKFTREEMNERR